MSRLIPLAVVVALLSGCMGGPPTRSVANDPAEMARRHAAVNAEVARRSAASERHAAARRAAQADQASHAAARPNQPAYQGWTRPNTMSRSDCRRMATRADLDRGACN